MVKLAAILAAFVTAASPALSGAAVAQTVSVTVLDQSGAPVVSASVYQKSASGESLLATTDTRGIASIAVPAGTSVFVRGNGAQSPVAVVDGPTLRFYIALKTILTVSARRPMGSNISNAQSAAAILSGDVGGALAFVPNYRTQSEGGSGSMELNGTPLSLPSGANSTRFTMPSDLISSFSPDRADDGSITPNYHLQAPTSDPRQAFSLRTGSEGVAGGKATLSGPGYAFVLSNTRSQGRLFGQSFADASGFTYDHSTGASETAYSADMEFRLGGAHVSIAGFGSTRRNALIDFVEPGTIAEGVGPGNLQTTSLANGYIRAAQTRGRDELSVLHVAYQGSALDDDRNAVVAGTALPSYFGFRYSGRYDEVSLTRAYNDMNATLKLSNAQTLASSFSGPYESVSKTDGTTVSLGTVRTGMHGTFTTHLEATREAGPFTAEHVNASIGGTRTWNAARLTWSIYSTQSQIMQTYYAQALRLSEPGAADFSCSGHAAFASGPSDVTQDAPHSAGITASLTRRLDAHTEITAGGFVSTTRNALVIASSSNSVPLSSAYLNALNTQYQALCGGPALNASDVYLAHYVTVPQRVDREGFLSTTSAFGRWGLITGYEVYSARALGLAPIQPGTNSTLIDGAQIWNVPLHRGSAIVTYRAGALTIALGALYTGDNNSAHLRGNAIFSGGLQYRMRQGTLNFSAQNIFHTVASTFTSPQFSAATPMTGAPVSFLATPVTPSWSLRYDWLLHAKASGTP